MFEHLDSETLKLKQQEYNRYYFAVISALAYKDPGCTKKHWDKLGYVCAFYDQEGAQCYVLENKDHIVVAFRGTEPKEWSDIKADMSFRKTWHRGHGRVHRGFMIEVWKLADCLAPHIFKTEKQVYITGHSLGGAMATLYSQLCRPNGSPIVYTYGAPRSGDSKFVKNFKGRLHRMRNNNDLVPTVPPAWIGFNHVGEVTYINHYGYIRNYTWWQKFKDHCRGHMSAWKKLEFFDGLRDHSMDKYCKALYNNWMEKPKELGGPSGPEPTRFGTWENKGREIDF